jgi:hypothetical protein
MNTNEESSVPHRALSVSLLLANIANHDLDAALSASSGKFVRFADDVVALCDNYDQAKSLEDCFLITAKPVVLNSTQKNHLALLLFLPKIKKCVIMNILTTWDIDLMMMVYQFQTKPSIK